MGRVAKLCVVLTAILFAGDMTVISLARLTSDNPFAPYASLMPGQWIGAVKDYPCQFQTETVNGALEGFCQFTPSTGPFALVALVEANQVIVRTSFDVQPNRLHFGDLVLCWDGPIYTTSKESSDGMGSVTVYWRNQMNARLGIAENNTRLDYSLPVRQIVIEHEWRPVATVKLACISA